MRIGIATSMITDSADVLADREHDAEHHRDRRGDHHRAGEHDQHLHLLHVVGDAGDQRRCAEAPDLTRGVAVDLLEDVTPHVAAEAHRRPCAVADGADGEHDLHEAEPEHDRAGPPDVAVVAAQHTVVDDVGVERRQCERGRGLDGLEDQDDAEEPPVRTEMGADQPDELHLEIASGILTS